jgi:hypothetical protein
VLAGLSVCGGSPIPLWAEPPQSSADETITVRGARLGQAGDPCVAVDAAGRRAGQTDCAAQKLQDAARAAQARAKGDPTLAVPNARSAGTIVGVGSLAASSERLGGDLRNATTLPQRHVPPPPAAPFSR